MIAHKLVFSLSEEVRERLGVELKDLVREVMASWSHHLGKALTWIALEHDAPVHPGVGRAGEVVNRLGESPYRFAESGLSSYPLTSSSRPPEMGSNISP